MRGNGVNRFRKMFYALLSLGVHVLCGMEQMVISERQQKLNKDLWRAVERVDEVAVDRSLKEGADVNVTGLLYPPLGEVLFKLAFIDTNVSALKRVIQRIVNEPTLKINQRGISGRTYLMQVMGGTTLESVEAVKILLTHPKIDVNERSNFGYTALMECALSGGVIPAPKIAMAALLLQRPEIDLTLRVTKGRYEGYTALALAREICPPIARLIEACGR